MENAVPWNSNHAKCPHQSAQCHELMHCPYVSKGTSHNPSFQAPKMALLRSWRPTPGFIGRSYMRANFVSSTEQFSLVSMRCEKTSHYVTPFATDENCHPQVQDLFSTLCVEGRSMLHEQSSSSSEDSRFKCQIKIQHHQKSLARASGYLDR